MTFLAKKEIGAPALGGRLARLQGIIFVDRGRRRCIPSVNAEMARAMAEGEPVVLFAEATTGDGNRILPLPLVAFRGGQGRRRRPARRRSSRCSSTIRASAACRSRRRDRPLFAWYGDMTFMPHFRRFVAAGPTRCDVHYGPPIPVSAEIGRKILARRTEAEVRALAARGPGRQLPYSRRRRFVVERSVLRPETTVCL